MQSQLGHISHKKTIFIGGLPGSASEKVLTNHFSKFGPIESISMVHSSKKGSNLSKGYALITFKQSESYSKALKQPEHYLFKRVVSCQPYLQGEELAAYLEDLNSRRLFVKYIPKNVDNKGFEEIFSQFGEVDFGYVVKDPRSGSSRGFGYITFMSQTVTRKVEKRRFLKIKGNRKLKIFPYKRRGSEDSGRFKGRSKASKPRSGSESFSCSEKNQSSKRSGRSHKSSLKSNKSRRNQRAVDKASRIIRKATEDSSQKRLAPEGVLKEPQHQQQPVAEIQEPSSLSERIQYNQHIITDWPTEPTTPKSVLVVESARFSSLRHSVWNLRFNVCPDLDRTNRLADILGGNSEKERCRC